MKNLNYFDVADFLQDLEQCDWSSINGFDNVDEMYEKWKHFYTKVYPFVTRQVRKCFLSCLSEDIIDDIKQSIIMK